MNKKESFILGLFALVVISGLAYLIWIEEVEMRNASLQKSKTIEIRNITVSESSESEENILKEAQRSLDRSLSILNTVATLMGGLVGLLTLIIIIAGYFGIMEIRNWRATRAEMEKSKKEIEKCAEEVRPIVENIKRIQEDANNMRNKISSPPITETPSKELKKQLNEFAKKIEFLEAFGVPLKAEDYFNRGNDFYYKDNYELALKAYDKAIELNPKYAEAYNNRGNAYYYGKKDYDRAIQDYDKAIELNPKYAEAYNNRGTAYLRKKDYDRAIQDYDKAIEHNPKYASAWYDKACAYSLKEEKENMLKNLSKAIELDSKNKEDAKKDEDFKKFWEDEDFKRIVS